MLVFIDESGDPGINLKKGASSFFILSMVIFEDEETAQKCSKNIEEFKNKIGWKGEFHFYKNSEKIKTAFFKELSKYKFHYYSVAIRKRLFLKNKTDFYSYSTEILFDMAKEKLIHSKIVFDQSGSHDFRNFLSKILKSRLNIKDKHLIKKVKTQKSSSNNLIQIADYVSGAVSRFMKKEDMRFRKILCNQEIEVKVIEI